MNSVTDRIKQIKQPGRYIKVSDFVRIKYENKELLRTSENVSGSTIGRTVDYLTRACLIGDVKTAFHYCLEGAKYADKFGFRGGKSYHDALMWLDGIQADNHESITCACLLSNFDLWYRKPSLAIRQGERLFIQPDPPAQHNIVVMVKRSLEFFRFCGGVVKSDFTFEPDGYTSTIQSGDGDYLTADTLWDMKVLRNAPTTYNALQVLVYWVMGQHSGQEIYKPLTQIGIYNPRFNVAYILDVRKVKREIIRAVEDEIICY